VGGGGGGGGKAWVRKGREERQGDKRAKGRGKWGGSRGEGMRCCWGKGSGAVSRSREDGVERETQKRQKEGITEEE